MIKAILILVLTSGYVSTFPSTGLYPTKAVCESKIGNADDQIQGMIKRWDANPLSEKLGKVRPPYKEVCMTKAEYTKLKTALTASNKAIVEKALKKAEGEAEKLLEKPTLPGSGA